MAMRIAACSAMRPTTAMMTWLRLSFTGGIYLQSHHSRREADPKPLKAILAFDGECPVVASDAHGPEVVADSLEMKRRMVWVLLQQGEILVSSFLHMSRKRIVKWAKVWVFEVAHAASIRTLHGVRNCDFHAPWTLAYPVFRPWHHAQSVHRTCAPETHRTKHETWRVAPASAPLRLSRFLQ